MTEDDFDYHIYGLSAVDLDDLAFQAEAGDAEAQVALGYCYEHGLQVPKDEKRAFALYSAAAEQGFANGIYNRGVGTCRDEEAACRWEKQLL